MQAFRPSHKVGLIVLVLLFGVLSDAWPQQTASNTASAPAATPVPPPSESAKRSAEALQKLVAPIALYPDTLIASILPASVYPVEIVLAARFVADTNNIPKIDGEDWDDNVKTVAKVAPLIKMMSDDLTWTVQLGQAFLAQQKEIMDAVQGLRAKAQKAGNLKSNQQQTVVVTNVVVESLQGQRVFYVTNTVVEIVPSNPSVVYVPVYDPVVVYAPPPPGAPLITFGAGIAVGAIIANNCDWHHGGVWVPPPPPGGGPRPPGVVAPPPPGGGPRPPGGGPPPPGGGGARPPGGGGGVPPPGGGGARPPGGGGAPPPGGGGGGQQWQPNQSRMASSGAQVGASGQARGYGAGGGAFARPSTGSVSAQPSTGSFSARPSSGTAESRSSGSFGRSSSSGSAFGGASSGSSSRSYSSRGFSSRSSGGFGGGFRGGGGGRGGGGRGR